jgi:ribosome biogenesis protein BMS1
MDDRPHKAHRPTQSGTKAEKKAKAQGKEKQHGFNEKVYIIFIGKWKTFV